MRLYVCSRPNHGVQGLRFFLNKGFDLETKNTAGETVEDLLKTHYKKATEANELNAGKKGWKPILIRPVKEMLKSIAQSEEEVDMYDQDILIPKWEKEHEEKFTAEYEKKQEEKKQEEAAN